MLHDKSLRLKHRLREYCDGQGTMPIAKLEERLKFLSLTDMEVHYIMIFVKRKCLAQNANDLMDDPNGDSEEDVRVEIRELEKL